MGHKITINANNVFFKTKELLLEFKDDAQVTSFFWSEGTSPGKIPFTTENSSPSKQITMHLGPVLAQHSIGYVLEIDATSYPCLTKLTWADKSAGQSYDSKQYEIEKANDGRC